MEPSSPSINDCFDEHGFIDSARSHLLMMKIVLIATTNKKKTSSKMHYNVSYILLPAQVHLKLRQRRKGRK